jgi:hypothetical protein
MKEWWTDYYGNCAACGDKERMENSKYCKDCKGALER